MLIGPARWVFLRGYDVRSSHLPTILFSDVGSVFQRYVVTFVIVFYIGQPRCSTEVCAQRSALATTDGRHVVQVLVVLVLV